MTLSAYDVPCPTCGAYATEPCWHLQRGGVPLKYAHGARWRRAEQDEHAELHAELERQYPLIFRKGATDGEHHEE